MCACGSSQPLMPELKPADTHLQVSWTRQRASCSRLTTTVQGRRLQRSCRAAWAASAAGVSAGLALPLTPPRYAGHVISFSAGGAKRALSSCAIKAGDISGMHCKAL
jgi:hypothetical protein